MRIFPFVVLLSLLLTGCGIATAPTKRAVTETDIARQRVQAEWQAEQAQAVNNGCEIARSASSDIGHVEVLQTDYGCYAGSFKDVANPYSERSSRVFDEGAYVYNDPFKGLRSYRGRFAFFHSHGSKGVHPTGSLVMVGTRTDADGRELVGIFIAENASADGFIRLILADQPYIDRVESMHAEEVAAFREEQRRLAERARIEQENSRSSFSFTKALMVGLGTVAIANTSLAADKKLDVAEAFTRDMLSDGEAGALDQLRDEQRAQHAANQRSLQQQASGRTQQSSAAADSVAATAKADCAGMKMGEPPVPVNHNLPSRFFGEYKSGGSDTHTLQPGGRGSWTTKYFGGPGGGSLTWGVLLDSNCQPMMPEVPSHSRAFATLVIVYSGDSSGTKLLRLAEHGTTGKLMLEHMEK